MAGRAGYFSHSGPPSRPIGVECICSIIKEDVHLCVSILLIINIGIQWLLDVEIEELVVSNEELVVVASLNLERLLRAKID